MVIFCALKPILSDINIELFLLIYEMTSQRLEGKICKAYV